MNKAENFKEFKKALQIMGIPRFNIVYADKEDNIFYMSNAQIPLRDSNYNWASTLPGNTSKTKTKGCFSIDDLPQIKNPKVVIFLIPIIALLTVHTRMII